MDIAIPVSSDSSVAAIDAAAVTRGVMRLFARHDLFGMAEVPLPNGRRTDISAIGANGDIVIVEIKCSRADLLGDSKWPDYLGYCDRFYFAAPPGFDLMPFDRDVMQPDRVGLIVADGYDAEIVRPAALHALNAARRKSETLRIARRAARRLTAIGDPDGAAYWPLD